MKVLKVLLIVDSLLMVLLLAFFCLPPHSLALLSASGTLAGLNAVLTRYSFQFKNAFFRNGLLVAGTAVALLSAALTLGTLGG